MLKIMILSYSMLILWWVVGLLMDVHFPSAIFLVYSGGPTTIVAWAGKDASKFFNEIHKGVKSPDLQCTFFRDFPVMKGRFWNGKQLFGDLEKNLPTQPCY